MKKVLLSVAVSASLVTAGINCIVPAKAQELILQTPANSEPKSIVPEGKPVVVSSSVIPSIIKDGFPIITSLAALCISCYVAYRTFFAKFRGKVWSSTRLVLTQVDGVPSLGLACFLENSGAKPGTLEDLRAKVELKQPATVSYFYPLLMRGDYSIYRKYRESDWYPFSALFLAPNSRIEKYLVLKPKNDRFSSAQGELKITLELRWEGSETWEILEQSHSFSIVEEVSNNWGNPGIVAYQLTSDEVMNRRK